MINAQGQKVFVVTPPPSATVSGAVTTLEIDTKGFRYVTVVMSLGAIDNASAFTIWNLQESDTSGSGYTDIPGNVVGTTPLKGVGTTGDGRLPQGTDDNGVFAFFCPMTGRKRYLKVSATITAGTGGFPCILAFLSRAEEWPNTTAERGLAGMMRLPG